MADDWQLPSKPKGLLGRAELLSASDVPVHQKQPFILRGYRPTPQGPCGLFSTVFSLHNETGNMWTHLLGFGYFASVAVELIMRLVYPDEKEREMVSEAAWVLALVLATAFCLLCSFSYHLCSCTGRCVRECTYRMDLSGIVVLIAMSYFTGIALGYRCSPALRNFYLVYAACIALFLAVPLLRPRLIEDMTRHFIVCVALGVVPAAHFVSISSREDIAVVVPHLFCMFGCYAVGAWFFVVRWPERQWPGRFDLLGHSHQVWHIFVLLAALSWVRGSFAMLDHFGGVACESGESLSVLAGEDVPSISLSEGSPST